MKNQENVFVMNVNGDMFLMLEGLAYSRRYQNIEIPNTGLLTTYYDMGVYIQVNVDSITGGAGRKIKKFIGALLDEELIYCVGTDAHDKKHRPPKMKKAAMLFPFVQAVTAC